MLDSRIADAKFVWYSNGCGMDIGVKDGKVVGVRGRAVDRVNKGRLGPKGLYGYVAVDLQRHQDALIDI